jgi:hypothetical protein
MPPFYRIGPYITSKESWFEVWEFRRGLFNVYAASGRRYDRKKHVRQSHIQPAIGLGAKGKRTDRRVAQRSRKRVRVHDLLTIISLK